MEINIMTMISLLTKIAWLITYIGKKTGETLPSARGIIDAGPTVWLCVLSTVFGVLFILLLDFGRPSKGQEVVRTVCFLGLSLWANHGYVWCLLSASKSILLVVFKVKKNLPSDLLDSMDHYYEMSDIDTYEKKAQGISSKVAFTESKHKLLESVAKNQATFLTKEDARRFEEDLTNKIINSVANQRIQRS
jgi:hypothetical protein